MSKVVRVAYVVAALCALAGCGKDDGDDSNNMAGTGGSVAATGGAPGAGTGGAGMAGAPALSGECATADVSAGGPALHAAAAALLAAEKPCAFGGCHLGSSPAATLSLMGQMDLHTALVGKMSCEAPNIPLVDGSGGEAALKNSWLWIKLTGPVTDVAGLTEQAGWGGPGTCGQQSGEKYGVRMPFGTGSMMNSEARLGPVRNWICGGAPGPQ